MNDFYSHAPCGARLVHPVYKRIPPRISTHTPRAGRDGTLTACRQDGVISTHTPRAGRDKEAKADKATLNISTHTPLTRRDQFFHTIPSDIFTFLLTRLLRGATPISSIRKKDIRISTHTPLTRRDRRPSKRALHPRISTHTPLTRRDHNTGSRYAGKSISTHTPLTRRDEFFITKEHPRVDFYSHASYEARLQLTILASLCKKFLLTRLLRGAT